ncbi:hypothetical protein JYU34_022932 [Plutella xylostella]|uniref:FMRFamide-related peptides n=1 Tax=Plutella xylostella TaxID=51655 RepID=A0ABQ7PP04_PLUXY|nr:hypothetical protein JYU34_022932 [Plutella xylostella]
MCPPTQAGHSSNIINTFFFKCRLLAEIPPYPSMWSRVRCLAALLAVGVAAAAGNPVRRSPGDLEARRRSAIDRSMIRKRRRIVFMCMSPYTATTRKSSLTIYSVRRFGRSPPEMTAADMREAYLRAARRGNTFLRLGRSQPLDLSSEDLITLLRTYNDDDYDNPINKRAPSFIRLGRAPQFIRLGRSPNEEKPAGYEQTAPANYPQRKNRARDHFLRLGRDSEELNDTSAEEEFSDEERRKRSTDCQGCH